MCCCPESNSLCVTFVIGKVSTGMVSRGAQWCGVANPEKNASDPVSKTATAAAASKTWFAKLASGVSLLYHKQCFAMETVPCDHPVVICHEFCLCTAVGMSDKWGVPVPNLSLLVMLCLVFVGECIGKVIKWLSKNINADASNLSGKAKFVVAVVGPVTLLSTDAALKSRVPQQSQGTLTLLLQSQICVTRWHHIMHAPVLQLTKNPGSPREPPRWYPWWSAIILSDIRISKPKLYILITKNSDMDFGKRISRFASRTCSWEYLGRPTVLWVAFGDRATT